MRAVKSIYFRLFGFGFKIRQNTYAILYQYNFSNEYSNVLEHNRSYCITESKNAGFVFIMVKISDLKADCGPKKAKDLEMINMKLRDLWKKISPTENTCIPIEMVCIDDVRSFVETQTKKNLSGVSWNDLTKQLYLDSFKIDKSFNPCAVSVWYEKIFNREIPEEESIDMFSYISGFSLTPFCSEKSIVCIKEFYTWDDINH